MFYSVVSETEENSNILKSKTTKKKKEKKKFNKIMQSDLGVEGLEGAARAGLAWKMGQPFNCGVDQTWTLAVYPSNTNDYGETRRDDKPSRGPGNFSCLHAYTNPPKVK